MPSRKYINYGLQNARRIGDNMGYFITYMVGVISGVLLIALVIGGTRDDI